MTLRRATCVVIVFLASVAPARAQRQAGSIVGRVLDTAGSPLARASVTLSGRAGALSVVTDSSGAYRFASVDPGSYELRADLAGLGSQLRRDVVVQVARQVELDFRLDVSVTGLEVQVEVAPPPLDASASMFDDNLGPELLHRMPFRRTAVALVDNAPGIHDQTGFGGDEQSANALLLDGVEFRDPGVGAPFVFLNYNWLDQMQVMGLGAPAEYGQYTGAIFNSVTRAGGNRPSGLFDVLWSDSRSLEPTESATNPERTASYLDVSAQFGGPLVRDKLFGFAGVQYRKLETDPGGGRARATNLAPRLIARIDYRPGTSDELSALVESDHAYLKGVGDVTDDALTTTVASPDFVSTLRWRHGFGERTSAELRYTGWSGYFDSNPTVDAPAFFDLESGQLTQSAGRFRYNDRHRHQLNATLSRYAERFGRHSLRFGLEVERSGAKYRAGYVDGLYVLSAGGIPLFAYGYGYEVGASNNRDGLFAQDAWQLGDELTVNAGLRLDWVRGSGSTAGRLYDVANLQPRLGLAWDVGGSGRRVLKAHYGRYHEAALSELWRRAAPGYEDRVLYRVSPSLLDREALLVLSRDFELDDGLQHPRVDELVAGLEAIVLRDARLVVAGIWRSFGAANGSVVPDETWRRASLVNPLDGTPLTLYEPDHPTPSQIGFEITNPEGFAYRTASGELLGTAPAQRHYRALLVSLSRAFAGGWQAGASYLLSKADGDLEAELTQAQTFRFGKYDDPNSALTNTRGELSPSRRHDLKLQASWDVPRADVTLAAYLQVLGGQHYAAYQRRVHAPGRPSYVLLLEPRGSRTLPTQTTLDLRVEKFFRLGTQGDRLGVYLDATNLLDARTVTERNACVPGAADDPLVVCPGTPFEAPEQVLVGRQLAFGARWSF